MSELTSGLSSAFFLLVHGEDISWNPLSFNSECLSLDLPLVCLLDSYLLSEVPSKLPMATHLSIHTLNLSCPHFLNGSLTQLIAQAKVLKVVIDFYHFYLLSLSCQHTLTFPSLNYS
jgi:hypothetical protein